MVFKQWWRARRLELTDAFATARIPHVKGSRAHVEVLFNSESPPSQEVLVRLEKHKDARILGEVSTMSISAIADWPEYQELMIQRCYRGMAEVVPNKAHLSYVASGVVLFNKTVSQDISVADRGTCTITRYVVITINRIHIAGHYHLLVGFELRHYLEANPVHLKTGFDQRLNQSAHSMRSAGKDTSGRFRSVGGPTRCGTLSNAASNFTISQELSYLKGGSLIDYNSRYPERRALLKNVNNSTMAVGLQMNDGKICDYPPEILEPVWRMENLPKEEIRRLKLKPVQWMDYIQWAAGHVRLALAKSYGGVVFTTLNKTVSYTSE